MPSLFLHFFRYGVRQCVGQRAGNGFELEAANAIELRLVEPLEQLLEVFVSFARKADNERRPDRDRQWLG